MTDIIFCVLLSSFGVNTALFLSCINFSIELLLAFG